MNVSFADNIGSTPAIVRRDTGEIILNRNTWFTLPEAYRQFILAHEIGHYVLQTTNELEADHYAFTQLAGQEHESLKNTVRTLFGVLPFTTELQGIRLQNMLRLALEYDQLKQPTAARAQQIKQVKQDILAKYALNDQLQQYMFTEKGKVTDYEFPGYDPAQFSPSVGRWFRDIAAGTGVSQGSTWQTPASGITPTQQPKTTEAQKLAAQINANNYQPLVSLSSLPDYPLPFKIDWKSVAIGILLILAYLGLKKS